jgi:hypothetical protein
LHKLKKEVDTSILDITKLTESNNSVAAPVFTSLLDRGAFPEKSAAYRIKSANDAKDRSRTNTEADTERMLGSEIRLLNSFRELYLVRMIIPNNRAMMPAVSESREDAGFKTGPILESAYGQERFGNPPRTSFIPENFYDY